MDSIGNLIKRPSAEPDLRPPSAMLPADLRPMDPRELAVKMESTLAIWPLPDHWPQVAQHYREALAEVPADLVDVALRHARMNYKWLPKPSELQEPIRREWGRRLQAVETARHNQRREAEIAAQLAERSQALTPEERAIEGPKISVIVDGVVRSLEEAEVMLEPPKELLPGAQRRRQMLRGALDEHLRVVNAGQHPIFATEAEKARQREQVA